MAVEETIKDDLILIYGEENTSVKIDYEKNTLDVLKKIGSKENYNVIVNVSNQINEINNAVVNDRKDIVAGNQEIMLGFACDETDTYGGYARVGGGCFSSKDPSKVDRSGSYYCRYVAKNIVANGLAKKCEIGVSYAIGKKEPISLFVDTFGTSSMTNEQITEIILNNFNFNVANIINELDLKKPIYAKTSCYGHFGRNDFTWEKIKKLDY